MSFACYHAIMLHACKQVRPWQHLLHLLIPELHLLPLVVTADHSPCIDFTSWSWQPTTCVRKVRHLLAGLCLCTQIPALCKAPLFLLNAYMHTDYRQKRLKLWAPPTVQLEACAKAVMPTTNMMHCRMPARMAKLTSLSISAHLQGPG